MGATEALLLLPDWCWQTYYEVITYVEQITDDEENSIQQTLCRLTKRGLIETKSAAQKRSVRGRRTIFMYKRVSG